MINEYILGVKFTVTNIKEALTYAMYLLREKTGSYVVTPNPEFVMTAREDKEFLDILNNSSMSLPDGIGIVIGSKILGGRIKQRVTGYDFTIELLKKINGQYSVYFLGGKPNVAKKAAENAKKRYNVKVAGYNDGYFKDDIKIAEEIKSVNADIVLVCMGAPLQEKFIAKCGYMTGAKLMLAVGGTIDVLSDNVKRAPKVFQKTGTEWLYRLISEPKRITRMIKLPLFLIAIIKARISGAAAK